jgi:SAM-dependent methyltransferase
MPEVADRRTGDPAATMRAAYDRIAPDYAAANRALQPELLARYGPGFVAAARAAAAAAAAPRPRVIEVGCGPGRDMAWLEVQGLEVVGVGLGRVGHLGHEAAEVGFGVLDERLGRVVLEEG